MRIFGKILAGTVIVLLFLTAILFIFDYDYLLKGIRTIYLSGHSTAYIDDFPHFDNAIVQAPAEADAWPLHQKYNGLRPTPELLKLHSELETVAFLVVKNDSILHETYAADYGPESLTNSFSMAKSVVVALLGRAITEGDIQNLSQPVADFFPQFDPALTVGDLASMSSGLNWDESFYNPFSMNAKAYFDSDIRDMILDLEVVEEPGRKFEYLSGNTQLLAMVVEKATGVPLAKYLSRSLWKPLGMRTDALWQLDSRKSGMVKAFCCLGSNARDFARLGKLFLDRGKLEGRVLIDPALIETFTSPRFEESPYYGYGVWLAEFNEKEVFYFRGILGQYVIMVPKDDLIIVRLGKQRGNKPEGKHHPEDFWEYLEEVYEMLSASSVS